jgi:hypothetical protein
MFFYIIYSFHPPTTTLVPPTSLKMQVRGGLSLSIHHHCTLPLPCSKHESEGITGPMFNVLGHECKFSYLFLSCFYLFKYTN